MDQKADFLRVIEEKWDASKVNFIVPAKCYNLSTDTRLLIPFVRHQKIGFVNQQGTLVVKDQFDIVVGDLNSERDLIKVGVKEVKTYERSNGQPQGYLRDKWGVMDAQGNLLVETQYYNIFISDDMRLLTLQDNGHWVIDREGTIIVPKGEYEYIDGFTQGYARAKKGGKWGIINTKGEVVLSFEYDNIWNFYNKQNLYSTKIIKDGQESRFMLKEYPHQSSSSYDDEDDYGSHYGEYEGSYAQEVMGYSDDVINDAFEGDPDAYWNID